MQTPPPLPRKRPPDWWARNWMWFVPVLCVGIGLSIGGLFVAVLGFLRSSDAYVGAVARVRAAPAVIDALGTPLEAGYFLTGNVSLSGSSGKADLAIPVHGPKEKAVVYVVATKAAGEWHFDRLLVQIERTGMRIDLAEKPSKPPSPPPARPWAPRD